MFSLKKHDFTKIKLRKSLSIVFVTYEFAVHSIRKNVSDNMALALAIFKHGRFAQKLSQLGFSYFLSQACYF